MSSPSISELINMKNQLPNGLRKAQLAIPEALRPTAIYDPGVAIPRQWEQEYGAYVLSSVAEFFSYYSRYQNMADLFSITLWSFITHIRDPKTKRPLVPMIPRLMLLGEAGSGKSTDLELLNLVCACTDGLELEPTAPAMRSILGPEKLTALVDEGDILVGAGNRKSDVRAMLNASVNPNGNVSIMRGGQREKANVYGPAAIAALPKLEIATGDILRSLIGRSIKIYKVAPDEDIPQILEEEEGQKLGLQARQMVGNWVQANLKEIVATIPIIQLPPGAARHREAQKWKPLLAVARVAGGMWPDYAEHACIGGKDDSSLESFMENMAAIKNKN